MASSHSFLGHNRRFDWTPARLTGVQRDEIRARYGEALAEEPGLSRAEYARRIAPQYKVTAGTICDLLVGWRST
jgi:hypothetical protein